ncbi:hypothetical protein E8L99_00475 [Phreatobacter aquaticus]|uniref:Uncharacterized protein n=1 Tax=Phreatobacter aquaticus TaxID=2570229 RepID=A0A4D7QG57_9HYPH|nr:hypothetical protein [Phreatobacter aquaticus]QCK84377.1 hypothetical protein E8L99_00475 [Phreatobacter aquaticus]
MSSGPHRDDDRHANAGLNFQPIDLGPLLQAAQVAIGQFLAPLIAGREESAQIMRKHILRSEAELLRGLLAVVEKEEQKAETTTAARDRRPQRVPVE